jgi:hypothetical protein
MAKVKWKTDKNWKRFQTMLEVDKVSSATRVFFEQAVMLNGHIVEKWMRKTIRDGNFVANAALTIALKGENKPLIGIESGAQLFGAITTEKVTPTTVFVGVKRTNSFYNVAYMIHEGGPEGREGQGIEVTNKMRGLFLVLAKMSQGKALPIGQVSPRAQFLFRHMRGEFYPLRPTTTKILIPARRWVHETIKDPALWKIARKNYTNALKQVLKEMKKGMD